MSVYKHLKEVSKDKAINQSAINQVDLKKYQHTLKELVVFQGIGVHSGEPTDIIIYPANKNTGIVFTKSDIEDKYFCIKANWQNVISTNMCTTIGNSEFNIATVEHLLSALYGLGISNALISICGNELPILDGCANEFCTEIIKAGIKSQEIERNFITIDKHVCVKNEHGIVEFLPNQSKQSIFDIKYVPSERFGSNFLTQTIKFSLLEDDFSEMISRARTFGFLEDAKKLWQMGLAKGSSLDNTIVIDDGKILNENGLQYEDEFVRHKMLDAIGDLSLLGCNFYGTYKATNPSHTLNYQLLKKFFNE